MIRDDARKRFRTLACASAGWLCLSLAVAGPSAAEQGRQFDATRAQRPATARNPGLPGAVPPIRNESRNLVHRVEAGDARVNRRLMGPVRRTVQGVPAEPVDSAVWDGVGSTPVRGSLTVEVEPMTNTGYIQAKWVDRHGSWTYRQTRFIHPDHHPSGERMSSTVRRTESVLNEGISVNVYLHGDTASGLPMLPTVFTYLATWGRADITLNGVPFENPFEIPAPQWLGHLMVTEGVRRSDGSVRTLSGEIYNLSKAAEGSVEVGDLEAHLVFHDDLFPLTANVPPPFSFFYHLVFEDVKIEMIQSDSKDRDRLRP